MNRAALALLGVAACRSPAPTRTETPAPTVSALPSASASALPAQPFSPDADIPGASDDATIDDPVAWLAAHGAAPPPNTDLFGACTAIRLGARDALLCPRGAPSESLPGGESVFPLRVLVVEGARTRTALAIPIAAGPLDREIVPGQPPPDDAYVELDATLEPGGAALIVREKPGKTCAKALADYKGHELAPHRRMIEKACAARGRYVLRNDVLVRERP